MPAEHLGTVGRGPAEVAVIVVTRFTGTASELYPGTAGDAALGLLAHAIAARARSAAVLAAVRAAATGALYVQGTRGEADDAAAGLLELIGGHQATVRTPPAHPAPAAPRA